MKRLKLKFKKVNIHDLNDRTLLMNLYATQIITLLLGLIIIFFQTKNTFVDLAGLPNINIMIFWSIGFALLVVGMNLIVSKMVPEHIMDDGGINDLIFKNRSLRHIAVICLVVAVCEEVLFRGAVQHAIGPYWTSVLFAAIHIRYLKHWVLTLMVFSISYGLGWIYMYTGTLWAPIIAHFLIDFILGCIIRYRRDS